MGLRIRDVGMGLRIKTKMLGYRIRLKFHSEDLIYLHFLFQSNTLLRERHHALNQLTPQCPVNFLTLHFRGGKLVTDTTKPNEDDNSREPWVYMACGHVVGQHNWKGSQNDNNETRTCPICSRVSRKPPKLIEAIIIVNNTL